MINVKSKGVNAANTNLYLLYLPLGLRGNGMLFAKL